MDLLKLIGPPGSSGFIVCGVAAGLLLRYRWNRARRFANIWLAGFTVLHLLLALPAVAYPIADALHPYRPLTSARRAQPLIVFDGDNRRGRLQVALQIYQQSPTTQIVVLGEAWLVDALVDVGVPRTIVARESRPQTTLQQMEWVRDFVRSPVASERERTARRPFAPAVIVSRLQMPRVAALAVALDIDAMLVASPVDVEPRATGLWAFLPTYPALRMSRDAIYEHAALAYYKHRGWIRAR